MWYLLILALAVQGSLYTPEQVHIAWTDADTSMSVTWASEAQSPGASVQYSPISSYNQTVSSFIYSSPGVWTSFPNSGYSNLLQRHLNVCKAYMTNLTQGGLYAYRVGSNIYGWTSQFNFQAKRNFADSEVVKFLVYGDLSSGDQIIPTVLRLEEELITHQYDAIIHNGDFAYDLDSDSGKVGDSFMRSIQPLASRFPYMTTMGNHEANQVLPHYINRFQMPGNGSNLWYSFNAGKAHFIAYSSELIFYSMNYTQAQQLEFLENDLQSYDRTQYPWLIVYAHRPFYCSANMSSSLTAEPQIRRNKNCIAEAEKTRKYFEDLWYENKVDLVIGSHVHAYERLGPAYRNQSVPCQEQSTNVCVNASAPVFVITGVPGNDESYAPDSPTPLPFSVAQDDHLGFSRLTIFNDTHLLWEQVRSLTLQVSDFLWLIKPSEEPIELDS